MIKKIFLLLVLLGLIFAGYLYTEVAAKAVVPEGDTPLEVTIPTGANYEQALDSLASVGVVPNRMVFDPLAERMNWKKEEIRPGRFSLEPGMTAIELIRRLRAGQQQTAKVILTVEREPMNVAAKAARFLEADSLDFVRLFQDESYLKSIGYTKETLQTLFIPNTYELYWNATPKEFVARMIKEHKKFWDADDRRAKAEKLGLTPAEVYSLASIVYSESLAKSEQKRIAGLYLNRLRQGIKLQSDPTAVFANRVFGITRVLYEHIEFDHPYNTYMNYGLPPGPIAMPTVSAIDAVLNSEDHDYIYMCAKGDNSGLHNFASTAAGHARNKAVYVANLKARGLR